ncbi:MAG: membrane dipeptidase [Anaerolineaceae bacterium]|nr:MAG: membrane dipeptidase [Anaerolineaceae bacterium]
MFIVDAHLDIAYNALEFGRDPLLSVEQIRAMETDDHPHGRATVAFPQLREAGVGLIFGTIFVMPQAAIRPSDGQGRLSYHDAQGAYRHGMAQLDFYRRLTDVEDNHLRLVTDQPSLDEVLASSQNGGQPLLGIVVLMEGADPIRQPEELEMWVERGLRAVGLAWDDTRYAAGAWRGARHGLTKEGRAMLEVMNEFKLILDLTHMSEKASLEALDQYEGPVMASHSNSRALVPGERQLSDIQIRALGDRDGVIGTALANGFLRAGHRKGDRKELVTLDHVLAHIDHVCQLLGDARHVGIGSDMDGGFGVDDIPAEFDSAVDLPRIATRLKDAGYGEADIAQIMGGNWLNLLRSIFNG